MSFECPEVLPRKLTFGSWLMIAGSLILFVGSAIGLYKIGLIVYELISSLSFLIKITFIFVLFVFVVFIAVVFLEKSFYAWLLIYGQICEAKVQSINIIRPHWLLYAGRARPHYLKIVYSYEASNKEWVFSKITFPFTSGGKALAIHPRTVTVLFCREIPWLNVVYRMSNLVVQGGVNWRGEANKNTIAAFLNATGQEKINILFLLVVGIAFVILAVGAFIKLALKS